MQSSIVTVYAYYSIRHNMCMDYKETHRLLLWEKRLTVMYIYNNLEGDHCIIMFNSHLTFQFKCQQ